MALLFFGPFTGAGILDKDPSFILFFIENSISSVSKSLL